MTSSGVREPHCAASGEGGLRHCVSRAGTDRSPPLGWEPPQPNCCPPLRALALRAPGDRKRARAPPWPPKREGTETGSGRESALAVAATPFSMSCSVAFSAADDALPAARRAFTERRYSRTAAAASACSASPSTPCSRCSAASPLRRWSMRRRMIARRSSSVYAPRTSLRRPRPRRQAPQQQPRRGPRGRRIASRRRTVSPSRGWPEQERPGRTEVRGAKIFLIRRF